MKLAHDILSVAITEMDHQHPRYLIGKVASESFRIIDSEAWTHLQDGLLDRVDPDIIQDLHTFGFLVDPLQYRESHSEKHEIIVNWESNPQLSDELSALCRDKAMSRIILKVNKGNSAELANLVQDTFASIPYLLIGKLRLHFEVDALGDTTILKLAAELPPIRQRRIGILPEFPARLLQEADSQSDLADFELDLLMDLDALGIPINLFEVINAESSRINMIDRMLLAYSLNGTTIAQGGRKA